MATAVQDYSLGDRAPETGSHYELLQHVLTLDPAGTALEFGVGSGQSTRLIATHMPVIGFDSWLGLPEDWRPGFPKGMFAAMPPTDIPNADFIDGWYEDTLPEFDFTTVEIGLVHIDCDLYSSTKTAIYNVLPHLRPGTYVVFDEWHGYDGCEQHEQRAWRELAKRFHVPWTVIGHGHESWSIQIA